jgi:murein DD-endopeptidase MepM/ murein hydrolase activator NlpD
MKQKLSLLLFLYLCNSSLFQAQVVIDTFETENGPMLIYSNRTWAYLKDKGFDGILNPRMYQLFAKDTFYRYKQTWDNSTCYTSGRKNDLSRLKDTFWMCVNDETHEKFVCPVRGVVTSRYGYRSGRHHSGIDLDLDIGDTVRAAWSGKVRYAKYNDGGFGNLVIVRHYNGLETFYAHLSKLIVVPDQDVQAGDVLGLGGNTGRSFGPHLHFEVRFFDASINPEEVIDFSTKLCKDENLLVHKGLFVPGAKPTPEDHDHHDHIEQPAIKPPLAVSKPVVQQANKKYYKVKSGDTLSEIAARNKTTVSKICQLNGIRPSTPLQIGRSLRIK